MLPSFFESVLQLIVRTSTDLPPDVRAAMKAALQKQGSELAALKQSQQQQLNALAKLTALVETSQGQARVKREVYAKH